MLTELTLNDHVSDIMHSTRILTDYKRRVGCLEGYDTYQRIRWMQYSNLDVVLDSSHTNLNNLRKTSIMVVIVSSRYLLLNTFFPYRLSKLITRESLTRFLLLAISLQKLTHLHVSKKPGISALNIHIILIKQLLQQLQKCICMM